MIKRVIKTKIKIRSMTKTLVTASKKIHSRGFV